MAISPQLPDASISTVEKAELKFPVLSDAGRKLAKQLGILWTQPDSMRAIFEGGSIDWKNLYGDDDLELPIPATFLVDKEGVIRDLFYDADYTKRLEPETALEWIKGL